MMFGHKIIIISYTDLASAVGGNLFFGYTSTVRKVTDI